VPPLHHRSTAAPPPLQEQNVPSLLTNQCVAPAIHPVSFYI